MGGHVLLGVRWQSVGLGHECSSLPVLHVLVVRPTVSLNVIPIAFHTQRTVALCQIVVLRFQFARSDLSSTLSSPAVKR